MERAAYRSWSVVRQRWTLVAPVINRTGGKNKPQTSNKHRGRLTSQRGKQNSDSILVICFYTTVGVLARKHKPQEAYNWTHRAARSLLVLR